MGTWNTGIFANDLALDVRAEYRMLLGDGLSGPEATRKVLSKYRESVDDPDESTDFWLALAATQWRCGRLEGLVKRHAIRILNAGADVERWREESPRNVAKREAALLKLKQELNSPQRPPTRIRKTYHEWSDWELGHAIAYCLLSGKWIVMRVIAFDTYRDRSRTPIVDLCDWTGKRVPDKKMINRMRARKGDEFGRIRRHKFALYSHRKGQYPTDRIRVAATGVRITPSDTIGTCYFGGWPKLDEYLEQQFGLK